MTRSIAAELLASAITSCPAAAAPLLFDFVALNSSQSISFTLDNSSAPNFSGSDYVEFDNVATSSAAGKSVAQITFYVSSSLGGFSIYQNSDLFADTRGPQVFSSDTTRPVFASGSYIVAAGNPGFTGGTLTIKAVAAAVPEPATWAMMVAGFSAIGFAMRRRKHDAVSGAR